MAERFLFGILSASFKGAWCVNRVILIDVLENLRRIIVITNTAECSGFVVDACIQVRTESSVIAVCGASVCPNSRLTVFGIPHFS